MNVYSLIFVMLYENKKIFYLKDIDDSNQNDCSHDAKCFYFSVKY